MNARDEMRAERRENRLCVDCGKPLGDLPYIRCDACREKKAEANFRQFSKKNAKEETEHYAEIEKRRAQIEKDVEREQMLKRMGKCLTCVWASRYSTHLFCPFPTGACMKLQAKERIYAEA